MQAMKVPAKFNTLDKTADLVWVAAKNKGRCTKDLAVNTWDLVACTKVLA